MSEDKTRIEKDSMGEFEVPENAMYGASTARAVENFQISDLRFKRPFIKALGEIKIACAVVNGKNGSLEKKIAEQIAKSAIKVMEGEFGEDFVVDIFQTGSGTSTNMNMNEVIARHASLEIGEEVHPNDHVNMSQSSNDVIPTATNITVAEELGNLMWYLEALIEELNIKAEQWKGINKNGRTHLMDATPVSLSSVFSGYAHLLDYGSLVDIYVDLKESLPIGGTAVGTVVNAPSDFGIDVANEINDCWGGDEQSNDVPEYEFHGEYTEKVHTARWKALQGDERFAHQGSRDIIVRTSGELKALAVSLYKISNDIRWMGSGPVSGLGELKLPALQPGSSIMPGKVNPVIPEMMMQVAAQVIGNDTTVTFAGTQGNFELNTMLPVMAHNVLESIEILSKGIYAFDEKCIQGLEANTEKMLENV
ncbi:MAG: class II fumarate hydratase, partial [Actinomycetota bacterium]|nr:class II fumarate hydratase [Actinomycetota bacterium]